MQASRIWLAVTAIAVTTNVAVAQERKSDIELDREAHIIYNSVLSPFCPGFMLINCTSSKAAELRDEVREMLASGSTRKEIMDELYERYGEEIRAIPKAEGFGLTAWIVPGVVLLIGGVLITFWLVRWRVTGPVARENEPDDIEPEAQARIDEEMANL